MTTRQLRCKGCGALMAVEIGAATPDKATIFHPEPLCSHTLALLAGGIATGPVRPARIDRDTGEITEEPGGEN